ncbi:hypothetical protein EDC04DRAFT_2599908 [Pisolithus marmoratus]|nr:hypothetical protein EDC04DRAFT_2599908 [Pisolithus marmoratus]
MDAMERELQEYHTQLEQHGYTNEIFSLCWDVSQIGKWYPNYKLSGDWAHGTWVYASSGICLESAYNPEANDCHKGGWNGGRAGNSPNLDRPQECQGNLPGLGYAIPICRTWIALVEGLQDFDMKAKVLPKELVVWFMLRRGEECCSLWSHDGSVQSAKAHGLTAVRERSAI